MSLRKSLLRFLVLYVVIFVLVYLIPVHIHRWDFDRAFMAWRHNPSPQNETALRVEQRKNEVIKLTDSAAIASILAALGFGTYFAILFAKHGLHRRWGD